MGRKTSAYGRRLRRTGGGLYNGAEWINAIQRCASYGEMATVAGLDVDTSGAAAEAAARVQGALESLMAHTPPADVERLFNTLSHALGVASIRAVQIEPVETNNPGLEILHAGSLALMRAIDRWTSGKGFGLDAQGRLDLPPAVDVYMQILRASSPAQMAHATDIRMKILRKREKKGA
jgi:hypothetical protein